MNQQKTASYNLASSMNRRYGITNYKNLDNLCLSAASSLSDEVFLNPENLKHHSLTCDSEHSIIANQENEISIDMRNARMSDNRNNCNSLDLNHNHYKKGIMQSRRRNKSLNDIDNEKLYADFKRKSKSCFYDTDVKFLEDFKRKSRSCFYDTDADLDKNDSVFQVQNSLFYVPKVDEESSPEAIASVSQLRVEQRENDKVEDVSNNKKINKYSDDNVKNFIDKFRKNVRSANIFENVLAWKNSLKSADFIEEEEHEVIT